MIWWYLIYICKPSDENHLQVQNRLPVTVELRNRTPEAMVVVVRYLISAYLSSLTTQLTSQSDAQLISMHQDIAQTLYDDSIGYSITASPHRHPDPTPTRTLTMGA